MLLTMIYAYSGEWEATWGAQVQQVLRTAGTDEWAQLNCLLGGVAALLWFMQLNWTGPLPHDVPEYMARQCDGLWSPAVLQQAQAAGMRELRRAGEEVRNIFNQPHAHLRVYAHTYKHTNIQTYIHTYIHTYMHTYMHRYKHTCKL
jgi:hypothetical protein